MTHNTINSGLINELACELVGPSFGFVCTRMDQFGADYRLGNHIVTFLRESDGGEGKRWDVVRHAPIRNRWQNSGLYNFEIRLSCTDEKKCYFDDERQEKEIALISGAVAKTKFLTAIRNALALDSIKL